jgi:hypothetical protein
MAKSKTHIKRRLKLRAKKQDTYKWAQRKVVMLEQMPEGEQRRWGFAKKESADEER